MHMIRHNIMTVALLSVIVAATGCITITNITETYPRQTMTPQQARHVISAIVPHAQFATVPERILRARDAKFTYVSGLDTSVTDLSLTIMYSWRGEYTDLHSRKVQRDGKHAITFFFGRISQLIIETTVADSGQNEGNPRYWLSFQVEGKLWENDCNDPEGKSFQIYFADKKLRDDLLNAIFVHAKYRRGDLKIMERTVSEEK